MDFNASDKIDDVLTGIASVVAALEELNAEPPEGISGETLSALLAKLQDAQRVASQLEEQRDPK